MGSISYESMVGNNEQGHLTRRAMLKKGCIAGSAIIGGTGTTGAQKRDTTESGIQFDRVVNMKQAGADPSGEDPVDPIIEEHMENGTLLFFPAGRYRIGEFHFDGLENFGLKGAASNRTTLVPEQGDTSYWILGDYLQNFLFQGFQLDHSAEGTGPRVQFEANDGLVVRDVSKHGLHQANQNAFRFDILTESGSGLVERLRAPDGAGGPGNYLAVGILTPLGHVGHLTYRNCHVEGFPNNGLYTSGIDEPGSITVDGGLYRNNSIAQVRIATSYTEVRNARIEVTKMPEYWADETITNMRGIRQAQDRFRTQDIPEGPLIKNCDIVMTADGENEDRFTRWGKLYTSGGIVSNNDSGSLRVKNTRIHTDMDGFPAVHAKPPENFDGGTGLRFENVTITGDAAAENESDVLFDESPAVVIKDRDRSTFENVCIKQTGTKRDGIKLDTTALSIENSNVNVTRDPFVTVDDGSVTTENVRFNGNC